MKVVLFCGGYGRALLAVPPRSAFRCVDVGEDDRATGITTLQEMPLWENGGDPTCDSGRDPLPPAAALLSGQGLHGQEPSGAGRHR